MTARSLRHLVPLFTALLLNLVSASPIPLAQQGLEVDELRCEYLFDPLGIDVTNPRLSWLIRSDKAGTKQSAYQVLVARTRETLQRNEGDLWDSGRVASDQSVFVRYSGKGLPSGEYCYWKVRVWDEDGEASAWSSPGTWSMGLLQPSDWKGLWIGLPHREQTNEGTPLPFPWLRTCVDLDESPHRAAAYVNPLGYYELYINGRKVDDHVLSPAVSDYSRRNLYVTHDVTEYLRPGKNCVALWLGRGWYVRGHPGVVHDGPLVRAQIAILGEGRTQTIVATDSTWKVHPSPITPLGKGLAFGDYGGERYDSRLEVDGWNSVNFDDAGWAKAGVFDPLAVVTAAQMVEPNRIQEVIRPVSVTRYDEGGVLDRPGAELHRLV